MKVRPGQAWALKGPRRCPDLCSSSLNSVNYTNNSAWGLLCLKSAALSLLKECLANTLGVYTTKQHKAGVVSCVASHPVLWTGASLPVCITLHLQAAVLTLPGQPLGHDVQDHIFSGPKATEYGKPSAEGDRRGGNFGGWAASMSFNINTSFAKNWANQNFLLFSISPAFVVAVPEYYVADHRHEPNIHEEVQRGKEGNFLNNTLLFGQAMNPLFWLKQSH